MSSPRSRKDSNPQEIFAHWLANRGSGEDPDIEALCARYAAHARELRELWQDWERAQRKLRAQGLAESVSDRLRALYDAESVPRVTLEGETAPDPDFASAVLSRLAAREGAFGRYRLKGEVARGGQGAVLRVWDEDLRRNLAMKVMLGRGEPVEKGHTPPVDSRSLGRFLEEAQVTGQLDHPGIVPVHELGVDSSGRVYFTMKLVKGEDLRAVFDKAARRTEGWTQTRALGVLLKVCEAMAYAHSKNVIHRDLKPGNVMVGKFGEVFVMDWGLARVIGQDDHKDIRIAPVHTTSEVQSERREAASDPESPLVTMDGDVVGTPAYMSPEQAAGRVSEVGPQSDVYALGAMLYHLLVGHIPFLPRNARLNNYAIWGLVQQGPPPSISELAPDTPAELVAICERAMARDAGARYADMQSMAADLRAFLENRVVKSYEAGALAEARKWIKRNRTAASALAGLIVVAIASGFVAAWLEGRRRDEAVSNFEQREVLALVSEVDGLWPIGPEGVPRMESWLARARRMTASIARHAGEVESAKSASAARAGEDLPQDVVLEELEHDLSNLLEMQRALEPERDRSRKAIAAADEEHARMQRELDLLPSPSAQRASLLRDLAGNAESRAKAVIDLDPIEVELADLPTRIAAAKKRLARHQAASLPSTPRAGDVESGQGGPGTWSHRALIELAELADPRDGYVVEVERRLAQASSLRERSIDAHQDAWQEAIASIQDRGQCPLYDGLPIAPQLGLVPLRRDPETSLWEFWHIASGGRPRLSSDQRWVIRPETGLVLILVPGGVALVGSQDDDPQGPNFVPRNEDGTSRLLGPETHVREVPLAPYFLSKYEMTQGQFIRIADYNPSLRPASLMGKLYVRRISRIHPVEAVSWAVGTRTLFRHGLTLPTEAQWEFAARAGTQSAYWFGERITGSAPEVNFGDDLYLEASDSRSPRVGISDGHLIHAPVDSFAPNPWGFHCILGNLSEWCRDWFSADHGKFPFAPRSGEYQPVFSVDRPDRGGDWKCPVAELRSSRRHGWPADQRDDTLGLRPCRSVDP